VYYNRREFPEIFNKVMMQPESMLVQGRIVNKTMLALVYDKRMLTPQDLATVTIYRFHQLEFEKRKGKWLLTAVYLEE
jgi:hypothetical protein